MVHNDTMTNDGMEATNDTMVRMVQRLQWYKGYGEPHPRNE